MKKLAVVGVVVVVVGFTGWAITGARNQQASPPTGTVIAAAVDSSRSAPAVSASMPSTVSEVKRPIPVTPSDRPAESAMTAMGHAADENKHLFAFVQERDDEQTRAARKTFDAALQKLGEKALQVTVNRAAAAESEFVKKFGLKAAPMPVILVIAPNGAIAGGFLGSRVSEQQLLESPASPAEQQCLKALQDRKLVLLCAHNGSTKFNDAAMKGVNDFKADARFAEFTEIVAVNPADEGETSFLTQLRIAANPSEATTVFLAPPGAIVGTFTGATNKEALVGALQKASSGCGAGGCGPSGCGPRR